jgi:hypothetical protein
MILSLQFFRSHAALNSQSRKKPFDQIREIGIRCSWTGCRAHDWEVKYQGGFGNTCGNTFSSRKPSIVQLSIRHCAGNTIFVLKTKSIGISGKRRKLKNSRSLIIGMSC